MTATNLFGAKSHVQNFYGDGAISLRHRQWGRKLYMSDIDCFHIDWSTSKPTDMIEWKHYNIKRLDLSSPLIQSKVYIADQLSIPFFLIIYNDIDWSFYIMQLNHNKDVKIHIKEPRIITERDLILGLHKIRKQVPDDYVLNNASISKFDINDLPEIIK